MKKIYTIRILMACFSSLLLTTGMFSQTFVPVNVTGFNHDLIANGAGGSNRAEATTTTTFDDVRLIGDNVLYSKDFRGNNNPDSPPPFGLPDDRVITSLNLPGAVYLLADYNQNNALILKTLNETGVLTLETPGVFSRIAFLGASAEGVSEFELTLNFSDGTGIAVNFAVPDWFSGPNYAMKGIGRIHRTQIQNQGPDEFNGDAENPRLYDNQIVLDPPFNTKILTHISFVKTSTAGRTAILAINGITAINAPEAVVANAATEITKNTFTANWSASAGATEYYIDVSESPTFSTLIPAYNNLNVGNTLSQGISGLSNGITYYYRVRAANISGVSPSSNTVNVNLEQCPPGQVNLTTQSAVNQFIIDYPHCTELAGTLFIQGSDITDLSPMSNIVKTGGSLEVFNNTALTTLNGINNIDQIGGRLVVLGNSKLPDLNPLNGLNKINGIISIDGNAILNDISGMTNIDLNGVSELYIQNNPALTVCEYDFVCNFLESAKPRNIANNAGKCIDEQAVKTACDLKDLKDGEYCSNAIPINILFGHPIDEPQASGTYSSKDMNNLNDPNFGHDCLSDNNTIWFTFTGDGNRYAVRSNDCSAKVYTNPNGAMYSGTCGDLTAINCHRDIWTGDVDPDINFRIVVQTEPGKTYYLMVEVTSTDDFVNYDPYGEFCLEVTRLDKECLVNIPDVNFKTYLLENFEINTNGDDKIECEEAEGFFGLMDCSGLDIADMTGLEAFTGVSAINCSGNKLSSLDVSKNTSLSQLNCSNNDINSLKLGENESLWLLNCSGNLLDNVDISKTPWLEEVDLSDNRLASFDISGNVKISRLSCHDNLLSYLNLANGNNALFQAIDARNNPELICIQVDDATYSNTNWSSDPFLFDPQREFNEYCEPPCQNAEEIKANYLFAASACVGENVRIIEYGIFTPVADSVSFQWDFGNGTTSTERDPVVTYSEAGKYNVSLRLENIDCPLEITKEISIMNCLKRGDDNSRSEVFPNPSSGNVHVKADLKEEGDVLVNIYSTDHKNLFSKLYTSITELRDRVSLSNKGMVVVEFIFAGGIERHKVLLQE
ncbi:MAG: PKD domain-containing protein [Saprospiraceae bacterium]|nr:MAG: PKD domain-containing protein [Candidatus Parvibacillus calidus]MCO6461129.1 PKD domain-containing protein [Saprospiraceae bacterium]WKZ63811.1 MAG: PKD domain-containing protein [Saprospiraceae bacterium]